VCESEFECVVCVSVLCVCVVCESVCVSVCVSVCCVCEFARCGQDSNQSR